MLFLLVEHFKSRDAKAVYQRANEHGRLLPEGLQYMDSWVETNVDRCFLLMGGDDPRLFRQWVAEWHYLVEFEIMPVVASEETAAVNSQS